MNEDKVAIGKIDAFWIIFQLVQWCAKSLCEEMSQANLSIICLNFGYFDFNNWMLLCLRDAKHLTASSEQKKELTRSQMLQIVYGNEKLDTILSQVDVSQNSLQKIGILIVAFSL